MLLLFDLRHQYGISAAELQTFLLAKRPQGAKSEEKRMFSQANSYTVRCNISVQPYSDHILRI